MRCNWRRWLWGVVPLVGLGLAAAQYERAAIEQDLTERAERAMKGHGAYWAVVNFSGRDVVLTGDATTDKERREAAAELRRVWGVGDINNNAGLPPVAEPYTWSAQRRGDRIRLQGHYPNRAVRQTIIGMTKAAVPGLEVVNRMRLARGAPANDTWLAALSFGLKQLASLRRGEVKLDDLTMSISGAAEDTASYRLITTALKSGPPKGITLASVQIAAPVVSPYTWSAQFAGGQLELSGHVASEGARSEVLGAARTAAVGTTVVDRMEPAGGAPKGWSDAAAALIKQIVRLQSGSAEMKDTAVVVGGIAADDVQMKAVREGLRTSLPEAFKLTDQIRVREDKAAQEKAAAEKAAAEKAAAEKAAAEKAAAEKAAAEKAAVEKAAAEKAAAEKAAAEKAAAEKAAAEKAAAEKAAAEKAAAEKAAAEKAAAEKAAAEKAAAEKAAAEKAAAEKAAAEKAAAEKAVACRRDLSTLGKAHPVAFERGSAQIEEEGAATLDRIAAAIKTCPGVAIAAEGHADIEGSAEHNQRLSVKRAQVVADYLIRAGVAAEQVQVAGFGTSRPAASNKTAADRAKNRRTEIVVRP
ncbi:MAG TPA: OmpA family protein [Hyphomicrobiaceae bacterium]|nr:OmpA family protein [Hyphomicrobiaceae bacterium]